MEFTFEAIGTNTFLTYMADIEEFDEFSMKMLEHNEIEGILPFSYLQENRKKKIRYAITSYETLESYIRRPLSPRIWRPMVPSVRLQAKGLQGIQTSSEDRGHCVLYWTGNR